MQRRDLIRAFGAASALALLPHESLAAWSRVASGLRPGTGLRDDQLAFIGAIADTIFPRTDTPSATDVRVPAFVDVVVSENFRDADREAFVQCRRRSPSARRARRDPRRTTPGLRP